MSKASLSFRAGFFFFFCFLCLIASPHSFAAPNRNAPAAVQPPRFSVPPLITVSGIPHQVAVADFNGDGIPDMAVADDGGVDILIGKGDGTFLIRSTVGKRGAWAVAVGDMNNDGIPDLVVAYQGDPSSLGILLGNGDGTFRDKKEFEVGYYCLSVAVGDFNKDGNLDVVVAETHERSIAVFLGNGDGTVGLPTNYTVPGVGGPGSLAVGDFNDDGNLDIAAANGALHIFQGNGDGTFKPGTDTGFADYIQAADVNLDGRIDIVTNEGVFLNDGGGTFAYKPYSGAQLIYGPPAVGDFNGDGIPDVVMPGGIMLGHGDGTFAAPLVTYTEGPSAGSLAVGHFNSDGKLDVVQVASGYDPQLALYFGNGNGTLKDIRSYRATGYISLMAMADFNNDGNLDAAVMGENRFGDPQLVILLGTGYGTFRRPLAPMTVSGSAIATADFNNDGNMDLLVLDEGFPGVIAIYLGNGDGTFQPPLTFTPTNGFSIFALGDFNHDGKMDIAGLNPCPNNFNCGESEIYILLGNGDGTFTTGGTFEAGVAAESLVAADFNNDGILDLAVGNYPGLHRTEGSISVLLGNGDGTFQTPISHRISGEPQNILAADFNHDGNMDVVVFESPYDNGPTMSVLLGNGAGRFSAPITTSISKFTTSIAIADFNGDGFPDIAFGLDGIQVLSGDGKGKFLKPVALMPGDTFGLVQAGLMGNDKLPDIILGFTSFFTPVAIIANAGP
jgi:FG-GAP-like repeat/FG-GAP repeat